jgi:hypothetical protein
VNLAAYAAAHPQPAWSVGTVPGEKAYDSDPYDVIAYHGGWVVADAAANSLLQVSPSGHVRLLARFPAVSEQAPAGVFGPSPVTVKAQAVPTSIGRTGRSSLRRPAPRRPVGPGYGLHLPGRSRPPSQDLGTRADRRHRHCLRPARPAPGHRIKHRRAAGSAHHPRRPRPDQPQRPHRDHAAGDRSLPADRPRDRIPRRRLRVQLWGQHGHGHSPRPDPQDHRPVLTCR